MNAIHRTRSGPFSHWYSVMVPSLVAVSLIGWSGCEGARGPEPAAREAAPAAQDSSRDTGRVGAARDRKNGPTAENASGTASGQRAGEDGRSPAGDGAARSGATVAGQASDGRRDSSADGRAASKGGNPREPSPAPSAAAAAIPTISEVLERMNDASPHRVVEVISAGNRLSIKTENVRRLRLHRSRAPGLTSSGSVAILVDGQGIEWLVRTDALELERSASGAWAPVIPR